MLHYWSNFVTYETLSVIEIKTSMECADAFYHLHDVIETKN